MELLLELLQINEHQEDEVLLEDLGNLGQLGLGSMVNAFKQTYSAWVKGRGAINKETSDVQRKFPREMSTYMVGKDSEATAAEPIKNWSDLKKVFSKHTEDNPQAAIFLVDKVPVALMIGTEWNLKSVNDKVGLAWDFSKIDVSEDSAQLLTAPLSTAVQHGYRTKVVSTTADAKKSERKDELSKTDYNYKTSAEETTLFTKKYAGYTQTVREMVPFVNGLGKTFPSSRLTVRLILADKTRIAKREQRHANPAVDPKDAKLFKDDLSTRLAKYKNSKMETVDDAETFIKKVFEGGMKRINFAGSSYKAIPNEKYLSSTKKMQYFRDGTMQDLFSGKEVSMEFEADRKTSDYSTLYLTVKMVNGALKPTKMRYEDKVTKKYEVIKFD